MTKDTTDKTTNQATDEQIAVVEKMPVDEAITILEASLFSNWEGRDGQLPIAIRTALDELKALRELDAQMFDGMPSLKEKTK